MLNRKTVKSFLKKFSYFDIGLITVFIVVSAGFFLFFYRQAKYITIRIKVTDQDVLYARTPPATWYADRFRIGDKELDSLGRNITEIVNLEKFNVDSQRKVLYLDLKVRSTYDTRTKLYYVKGKSVAFGTPLRFNLANITFYGIITEYPNSKKQYNLKFGSAIIHAFGRQVEPVIAQSIKKDDKIYNSNGVLLAEVLDIEVKPAEQVTQNLSGDLLLRYSPLMKDIKLTIRARTKTYDGEKYIFDLHPLKIGESIPLNFTKVSLFPLITDFTEE